MKKTIKDIALMAGVSPSTVSKVINNYPDVGEETRNKIIEVMERTGYRSNQISKMEAQGTTNVIGVIYGDGVKFSHPFFTDVINLIRKYMGDFDYDLLIFSNSDEDFVKRCKNARIAGCIIIGGQKVEGAIHDLVESDIPCVGIDTKLSGPKSGSIMSDNLNLGKKVVEHFYLNGHRKIAHIGGSGNIVHERTAGFIQAMSELGLQLNESWMVEGDFTEESGYQAMKKILKDPDSYPTAVFSSSDIMAFGAIKAIKEHGLEVPKDIAIIGCDDIELNKYLSKPLSTVRQDTDKIGKMAAYMIIDLINNVMDTSSVVVDADLIVRHTG